MARLVVLSEGYTGRTYDLNIERTTVGRVDDNAVCIPDPSVSSHHAEIVMQGEGVVVRDLGSTNGSFVDGNPIEEANVAPGQIIRFGDIEIRLESGEEVEKAGKMDQTKILPKRRQGVNIESLERGPKVSGQTTEFFKPKKGAGTKVFIGVIALLALAVVGLIVVALIKMGG